VKNSNFSTVPGSESAALNHVHEYMTHSYKNPPSARLFTLLAFVACLASATAAFALGAGKPMPEIGLKDLNGQPVTTASLRGKVVIVDFWATWCAPCKEELPVLQRLYAKYGKDGLVVVGVSVDKDVANVRDFVKEMKLTFPIAHDPDHIATKRFEPPKMPSSYVVDRNGAVRFVHEGFHARDAKELEDQVKQLLAAK
jgi:cytochrome c biogenesis protein CcmG/thiol:disulfide interchange protein DsbE